MRGSYKEGELGRNQKETAPEHSPCPHGDASSSWMSHGSHGLLTGFQSLGGLVGVNCC